MQNQNLQKLKDDLTLHRLFFGHEQKIKGLLDKGMTASQILEQVRTENFLDKSNDLQQLCKQFNPAQEIEKSQKLKCELLAYSDTRYPALLRFIEDPPLLLYVQGEIQPLDKAAISIVGSRQLSFYGKQQANRFAYDFSEAGFTVVSGMAQGIDQVAHEGALKIPSGRTLGVLGCGMGVNYPKGSSKLREQMVERGAIISELPIGTMPQKWTFPKRNRIISGLSLGVLVVEAHMRSGTLITARQSLEQGRDVFAIPGPVDSLTSRGTHYLIKEGAYLADHPADVLEIVVKNPFFRQELELEIDDVNSIDEQEDVFESIDTVQEASQDSEEVDEILKRLPMNRDNLLENTNISAGRLSCLLLELEMNGRVEKKNNGEYCLNL